MTDTKSVRHFSMVSTRVAVVTSGSKQVRTLPGKPKDYEFIFPVLAVAFPTSCLPSTFYYIMRSNDLYRVDVLN